MKRYIEISLLYLLGLVNSNLMAQALPLKLNNKLNVLIYQNPNDTNDYFIQLLEKRNDTIEIVEGDFNLDSIQVNSLYSILQINIDSFLRIKSSQYLTAVEFNNKNNKEIAILNSSNLVINRNLYFHYLDSLGIDSLNATIGSKRLHYNHVSKDSLFVISNQYFSHPIEYIFLKDFWFLSYNYPSREGHDIYILKFINGKEVDLEKMFGLFELIRIGYSSK